MTTRLRMAALSIVMWVGLLLPAPASAEAPKPGTVRLDAVVELQANGDAVLRASLAFAARDYAKVKLQTPNPFQFLRDFRSDRANEEVSPDSKARYDDEHGSIVLDLTELGAVKNRGNGTWELEIEREAEFVDFKTAAGRTKFMFYESGDLAGTIPCRGQVSYLLPPSATAPEWDPAGRRIRYRLPAAPQSGRAILACDLKAKPRLITALYKVYGRGADFAGMWVAKAVFHNSGGASVRDFQVRCRLEGYSEWSVWEKCPEIVPGGTFVSAYYPVLDRSIAALASDTPDDVRVEWHYTDTEGRRREEIDGRRITLLGGHEFIFSNLTDGESMDTFADDENNAPFLAAWVSRDDGVVKELAALANKRADGVGAAESDETALKVLEECYQILVDNRFSYQHPANLVDRSNDLDMQLVQSIKFPRDVIRDKSGTCVDLAICYASMANALGLKPFLVLVPGHCFPYVELPSGQIAVVEATGVGGDDKQFTFDEALDYGKKEWEACQSGETCVLDVQDLWTKGISNPELDPLPANILSQWGITERGTRKADPAPAANERRPSERDPQPKPEERGVSVEGTWLTQVQERLQDGQTITYPMALAIQAREDGTFAAVAEATCAFTFHGQRVQRRLEESFVGRIADGALTLRGLQKVLTDVASGQRQGMAPDTLVITARGEGLVAKCGNSQTGEYELTFTRR